MPNRGPIVCVLVVLSVLSGTAGAGAPSPAEPAPGPNPVESLRTGDRKQKTAALRELLKMGRRGEPFLVEALSLPDPAVQAVALQMLGEFGSKDAAPEVLRLLKSRDATIQEAAVETLGRLRDPRALQPLLEYLGQAKRASSKCAALGALGSLGDKEAQPYAASLLQAGEPVVQCCAAGALGLLGDRSGFDLALERAASEDARIQRAAFQALGQLRDERALDALEQALADPRGKNRPAAHIAKRRIELRDKGRKEKLRLLARDLEEDEVVQDWAARELATLGDAEAVSALRSHLRTPAGKLRRPVLVQLYRLGVRIDER